MKESRDEFGRLLAVSADPVYPRTFLKKVHPEAILPSPDWDLFACLISETGRPSTRLIPSQTTILIPTGVALTVPRGYFGFVLDRSGAISVVNTREEVEIPLHNGGHSAEYIKHGQPIARLLFVASAHFEFEEVTGFSE